MSGILRLIAGGLLALICCYIGILVKRRYKEREKVYKSALAYARALKRDLSAKKTPIPQIVADFCKDGGGDFEKTLAEYTSRMSKGNYDADGLEIKCLKPAESKELIGYLKGFGGSALDEQLALASRLESYAAEMAQAAEKDGAKLGNMYFRLLVLLGLAIILILA